MAAFASRFVDGRLAGLKKDIDICLTPIKAAAGGTTHAYFPALAACCSTLEYLTALHRGNVRGLGWRQLAEWAHEYMPQPDYDDDVVRILFEAFRHSVAHRGIPSGVWIDQNSGPGRGRRLTWKVFADSKHPACEVREERGQLVRDPPWPCSYTHRVHIHLRGLWVDIRGAAKRYSGELLTDVQLQDRFVACMRQLYPA